MSHERPAFIPINSVLAKMKISDGFVKAKFLLSESARHYYTAVAPKVLLVYIRQAESLVTNTNIFIEEVYKLIVKTHKY